jgi:hypothetical protein
MADDRLANDIALVLCRGAEQRVIGRVAPDRPCDLAVVDRLLRVQLVARRRGWSLRLVGPDPDLVVLLELCGFGDVLGTGAVQASRCEGRPSSAKSSG